MYACTTSEPTVLPVFVTFTEAVRVKSALATIGLESVSALRVNVVYERPCLQLNILS